VTASAERDCDGSAVSHKTREHNGQVVTIETRVRVSTLPRPPETPKVQQQRAADRRTVELFQFEHGRDPAGPEDGEAGHAVLRERRRNLSQQMQAPPQPFEPDAGQWRRWTAARNLLRSLPHRTPERPVPRPREASPRRSRRGNATSRVRERR
jgi:hypothetical protein